MDTDGCCSTRIVKFAKDPVDGKTTVTFESVCLRTNQVRSDEATTATLEADDQTAAAAWALVSTDVFAWSEAIMAPPQSMVGKTLDPSTGEFV